MPRATLKLKSNEALVTLSERHPESRFRVLGAWPTGGQLRVLIETSTTALSSLKETFAAVPTLIDVEVRDAADEKILFEVTTPTPVPHGAMAESGVVPSFPLLLEEGWLVGDLITSREQLSAFRDELDTAGIKYQVISVPEREEQKDVLTPRQQEVVDLAIEHGYYDFPRRSTLTDLAEILDVNKSVVSRTLQRAESHLITRHYSSR